MSLFLAKPLSARFPGMRPPTELTKMSEPAIGSCTITLVVVIVAGEFPVIFVWHFLFTKKKLLHLPYLTL
jgi:hypothetical protein